MEYADKYIDLHAHLDGSVTVDIAKTIARIQGIALPAQNDSELERLLTVPEDCRNLLDFLKCFELPLSLMQTYEGLCAAAKLVSEKMMADGIVYGEIRYAPQLHTQKGMTQEDAINAVLDGIKLSGHKANVILCCMRGNENGEKNAKTIELAEKYLVDDGGVVAVDLAGAESIFPTSDYGALFAKARKAGIPFTIHAGEADGAESVRLAIEYGAVRIGHGVRAGEDPDVLRTVLDKGIFLEMCPTSNRQTVTVRDMSKYPFMDYLKQGIRVTLNTDDPAIEGTVIGDEFRYMEKNFGLTAEQEKAVLNNSVDAAFTTAKVKCELRKKLGL